MPPFEAVGSPPRVAIIILEEGQLRFAAAVALLVACGAVQAAGLRARCSFELDGWTHNRSFTVTAVERHLAVTARHNVAEAYAQQNIEVEVAPERWVKAKFKRDDASNDLALLKVDADLEPVKLRVIEVVVSGSGEQRPVADARGELATAQFDGRAQIGYSGSPVLLGSECIGILVAITPPEEKSEHFLIIGAAAVLKLLKGE